MGVHVGPWFENLQAACGPAGAHGRVKGEDGVPGGNRPYGLENPELVAPGFFQRLAYVAPDGCDVILESAAFVDVLATDDSQPLLDHGLGVGDYRHGCVVVLADCLAIQQHVDYVFGQF